MDHHRLIVVILLFGVTHQVFAQSLQVAYTAAEIFTFLVPHIEVEETNGMAEVIIQRVGTSAELSRARQTIVSNECPSKVTATAKATEDYSLQATTIKFQANDQFEPVIVTIQNDEEEEFREFFCLTITTYGVGITTMKVYIKGNDYCVHVNSVASFSFDVDMPGDSNTAYVGPWSVGNAGIPDTIDIHITPQDYTAEGGDDLYIFLTEKADKINVGSFYGLYLDDSDATIHLLGSIPLSAAGDSVIIKNFNIPVGNGYLNDIDSENSTVDIVNANANIFTLQYIENSGEITLTDIVNSRSYRVTDETTPVDVNHIFVASGYHEFAAWKVCGLLPRKLPVVGAYASGYIGAYPPSHVIDNGRGPALSSGCFISDMQVDPWVQVDLGSDFDVKIVLLWPIESVGTLVNSLDLANAGVYVSSCPTLSFFNITSNHACDNIGNVNFRSPIEINCDTNVKTYGRYVYIVRDTTSSERISLCEIEVYGDDIPIGDEAVVEFSTPMFSTANYESAGNVAISATRSGESLTCTSVDFYTDASSSGDFTAVPSNNPMTLSWTKGDISGTTKTANVAIPNDNKCEADKTFNVYLTNVVGGNLGMDICSSVTIVDDDCVILNDVTLDLDSTSDMSMITEQSPDDNEFIVHVGLVFDSGSAEFVVGSHFWDINFFLAADGAGTMKIVDAKNVAYFNHEDGAVVAGGTTQIPDLKPQFDLTDKTCRPADPYMYLCATVQKNPFIFPAPNPDFNLSPEDWTTCIKIGCERFNREFKNLTYVNVTSDNVLETVTNLSILANDTVDIDVTDLNDISGILNSVVEVEDSSLNVTEAFVDTIDSVIENYTPSDRIDENNSGVLISAAPNQIQRSLEQQISTFQTNPGNATITERNLAIEAVKITQESAIDNGVLFEVTSDGIIGSLNTEVKTIESQDVLSNANVAAISFQLTTDILNSIGVKDNNALPVSFLVYNDATLFPSASLLDNNSGEDEDKYQRFVASSVISATIEGTKITNLPKDNRVESLFSLNKVSPEELNTIITIECVFWDTAAYNGLGDWSNDGCQYQETLLDGRVVCHCDHLTSFAVIVDIHGHKLLILDLTSKIGCGISITCLLITLATYLSARNLRQANPKKILISFCFSLLCLYIVFVLGIERGSKTDNTCVTVSALLHYFTLTSMAWMAVEAFQMYVSFVKVVGRWSHITNFVLKASIIAWGLPAFIVILVLAADVHQYNNKDHCFLKIGYAFYFTHLLILGLIVGVNMIIFVLVMHKLTCGRKIGAKKNSSAEIKRRVQNAIAISLLMGLTWVFGLFALIHQKSSLAFQFLFCIFNSLQGAFIFVMFCLRQPDVMAVWKEKLLWVLTNEQNADPSLSLDKTSSRFTHDVSNTDTSLALDKTTFTSPSSKTLDISKTDASRNVDESTTPNHPTLDNSNTDTSVTLDEIVSRQTQDDSNTDTSVSLIKPPLQAVRRMTSQTQICHLVQMKLPLQVANQTHINSNTDTTVTLDETTGPIFQTHDISNTDTSLSVDETTSSQTHNNSNTDTTVTLDKTTSPSHQTHDNSNTDMSLSVDETATPNCQTHINSNTDTVTLDETTGPIFQTHDISNTDTSLSVDETTSGQTHNNSNTDTTVTLDETTGPIRQTHDISNTDTSLSVNETTNGQTHNNTNTDATVTLDKTTGPNTDMSLIADETAVPSRQMDNNLQQPDI